MSEGKYTWTVKLAKPTFAERVVSADECTISDRGTLVFRSQHSVSGLWYLKQAFPTGIWEDVAVMKAQELPGEELR